MTSPSTPDVDIDTEALKRLIPPYRVILHNDDRNSMDYVVRSLMKTIPGMDREKAHRIMMEAHNKGKATVVVCSREEAEMYCERLTSCQLTASIEQI